MTAQDFIKIKGFSSLAVGDDELSEFVEIFQGLSCGLSAGSTTIDEEYPGGMLSEDPELSAAIWTAQNTIIEKEIIYLEEIEEIIAGKKAAVPKEKGTWLSLVEEMGESAVGTFVYSLVLWFTGGRRTLASVSEYIAEVVFGWGLERLENIYDKTNQLCVAFQEENTALLLLESTRANYDLRTRQMMLHTDMIENLLRQAEMMEKAVTDTARETVSTELVESLKALQYNNEEIDLGGVRMLLRGKAIEM